MTALIRAEITKLRTTATARWLLAATAVLAVLAVMGFVFTEDASDIDLATPYGVRAVLHAAATGSLLVLVLGIIGMTGEFRTGTITDTLHAAAKFCCGGAPQTSPSARSPRRRASQPACSTTISRTRTTWSSPRFWSGARRSKALRSRAGLAAARLPTTWRASPAKRSP